MKFAGGYFYVERRKSMLRKDWNKIFTLIPFLLGILLLPFPSKESFAQKKGYPEKPIKLIVGTQPGGLIDLGARAWCDEFAKRLGVPVMIMNIGGASGTIALAEASKAKPDGYTLVAATQTPMVISPTVTLKLPYDSTKDFVPIGTFGVTPTLFVVNSNSPFKTIDELLDYAKKNPGKLICGGAGVAAISNFSLELIKFYEKVDIKYVPFKGAAPAVTALLGNHVDFLLTTLPTLSGHLRAARFRGLATTTKFKEFPEIPLFSEKRLAGAGMETWAGFFAPVKIPKEAHRKLVETFEAVVKDQGVIQRLENVGYVPYYIGPDALAKLIKEELSKIAEMAKRAGIEPE